MFSPELTGALQRAVRELGGDDAVSVQLERPANPAHGDLATNVALILGPVIERPPRDIAQDLLARLDLSDLDVEDAEIAGPGFINFRLRRRFFLKKLGEIVRADEAFGSATWGDGERVNVEFVSANPTGPLHVGHGRGAAVGDAIARLLEWTGHSVWREFYVNDAGAQVEKLVDSIEARVRELRGLPSAIPEGGYHGQYVIELARELLEGRNDGLAEDWGSDERAEVRAFALRRLMDEQADDLRAFHVELDEFRLESELYASGAIEETLELLEERGVLEEREGAIWLRTSRFGDDKDRVLVKSDGTYTYFLPDIAYHRGKAARGFARAIDIWGADHHGYVPRMRAAMETLGLGAEFLEAHIVQLVRVERGGEEVKFSKRSGEFITLRDLIEEVGPDVTRYFFLQRGPQQQMVFDLDLALERSEKNPVYKVQYAHARIRSIYRRAGIAAGELDIGADLDPLERAEEIDIIKTLLEFPDMVTSVARAREPHRLTAYLEGVANQVNSWYHAGHRDRTLRVLGVEEPVTQARLVLVRGAEVVLRNGLDILGLSAPERM